MGDFTLLTYLCVLFLYLNLVGVILIPKINVSLHIKNELFRTECNLVTDQGRAVLSLSSPWKLLHPQDCAGLFLPLHHTLHSTWVSGRRTQVLGLVPGSSHQPWRGLCAHQVRRPLKPSTGLTVLPGIDSPHTPTSSPV